MASGLSHYCPKCDSEVYFSTATCPRCNLGRPDRGWPVDQHIGAVITDKYRIHKRIGRGGMGSVYIAEQVYEGTSLGNVAVKFLQPFGTAQEQDILKNKFISEARYARMFNSPHIIKVYDFGTHEGETFMAMELLQGETLEDILYRRGSLSVQSAVDLCMQIAEALAEVHRHDVVHRDIKPENILVLNIKGKDFIKLLDFGIAKRIDPSFQKPSTQIGTPAYMAPEQLRGERIDARADIYALGILMHTCLAGEPPFSYEGLEDMPSVSYPIPDIGAKRPGLSDTLRRLVNSMMHPDPDRRPPTTGDVVDALRSIHAPPPARPKEPDEIEPVPLDPEPFRAITHRDAEPTRAVPARRPPPSRFKPVSTVRRPWGTGQVLAAAIIVLGLVAVGDYVYINYLDGKSWNDIVQGNWGSPPTPAPVDATNHADDPPTDAAAGDPEREPVEKKRKAKKKKKRARSRK